LKGFYISKSRKSIPFTAAINDSDVVAIYFTGFSASLAQANIGNGYMLHVTKQSFEDFKSRVLDKNVEWTNATIMPDKVNVTVPGKWVRVDGEKKTVITGDERPEVFDGATKGYGGSRKHNHRKPTKRRRSRRVYRKTKKN
jgi:hypothetical protein